MPARTGKQYIEGLRERPPNLYMNGKQVKDPTTQPGLGGGIKTLARLYDLQHDSEVGKDMTYKSPTTGDQVGMSFLTPKTHEDLDKRREMMRNWARITCGMMGRTPDFLNVSLMAMAAAGKYFGENRPDFEKNMQDYYEFVREKDLVLTHTLVNIQRNRSAAETALDDSLDVALSVVKETDEGIVVHGARVLATLPIADEIAVYPARSHRLPTGAPGRTSFAFAIPCDTPGLKFQCREPFDLQRSTFDHPLGSRFEEMDALAFFDHVLVPWERVFLFGDVEMCNNMSLRTHQFLHSGHQVVTKNVVKCEFILGLANLMVKTLGSSELPQVHGMMAEIIENLEITKALLRAAEGEGPAERLPEYQERFRAALADDLNAPKAMAVVWDVARSDQLDWADKRDLLLDFERVLGLSLDTAVVEQDAEQSDPRIDALVAERETARKAKDFATSDRIRDELAAEGIVIKDSPDGPRWSRK